MRHRGHLRTVLGWILWYAVTAGVAPTPVAFGHGPEPFRGEASWDPSYVTPKSSEARVLTTGPSVRVALNFSTFRPGQPLAVGLSITGPTGSAADLLIGAILPGGNSVVLFSRSGAVTFTGPTTNLSALPVETVPSNFSLNNPGWLFVTLPLDIPTGRYLVFAALLQQGTLANNQLAVLATDTKTFTVSTNPDGAQPILQSPFAGQYPIINPFDHSYPMAYVNTNGVVTYYWGEQLTTAPYPQSDPTKSLSSDLNHAGWDFRLPEGTPLFAAGDGTIALAGSPGPSFCPPLNTTVDSRHIHIDHIAPNGKHFVSVYEHVGRIEVQIGQQVVVGQPIGLSGNTGCSSSPHLHFQVNATTFASPIDPYGWDGSFADPWAVSSGGVPSVWLWRSGREPTVFWETNREPNPSGSTAKVTITAWRWMGVNDARNPNNEFVEITLDPRYVTTLTFDMTGFVLRNNDDDEFTFPTGFQLRVGRPVRIYTGPGVATETELYWGLDAGVWDNTSDCARLVYPTGGSYSFRNTTLPCR